MECLIGVRNALIPSLALWAVILVAGFALAGCVTPHDDGMGDLWKVVKYVQRRSP